MRDGEKVSGNGVEGLAGEVGCGGRRKWGRDGAGVVVDVPVIVGVWDELEKIAGIFGAGTRKRWDDADAVFGAGVCG